jgi:hypothetical protein
MATPEQKAAAGLAALQRLQLTQPDLQRKLSADWSASKLTYSAQVRADVAKVKEAPTRAALVAWFSDPKAVAAFTKGIGSAVGSATSGIGDAVGAGAGAVGALPSDVGSAVGQGLVDAYQGGVLGFLGAFTNANTWLRVGEVVLGLLLVVAGVVKLVGPGPLKATPVGRLAKAVR